MRCIAHIINIVVQEELVTLVAAPAADENAYRAEEGEARVPSHPETRVTGCLAKLRRHIYVFRNRREWRAALTRQAQSHGLKGSELCLDMLVRWSSMHEMLVAALKLRAPITAHCASQQLDLSMHDMQLLHGD